MHVYWRVQQELNEIGLSLVFHHPNLIRAFRIWVRKNACGLALAEDLSPEDLADIKPSLN